MTAIPMASSYDPSDPHASPSQGEDEPRIDAEPTTASTDAQGRKINPRSCVTCRRRKVKCDKVHPCANCVRAHIECIFPAPGRAPRRFKKVREGRDKELLERLRRLEGMVKGLGGDVPAERQTSQPDNYAHRDSQGHNAVRSTQSTPAYSGDAVSNPSENGASGKDKNIDHEFGRLVISENRSHYVNSSFWANLSNEVEDLKGMLYQSSDDEGEHASVTESDRWASGAQQSWMFGYSSQNVDMSLLHPLAHQITTYWDIYKDRVDPLVKILHVPTFERKLKRISSQLSNIPKGFEALLFAIYYAVATSLSENECRAQLGEEKSELISRYTFGVQQGLARANFLVSGEIVVLQALVIWLLCLRRNDDGRVIWTLTGLVVRIAQTIGIHRDGTHFGLAPLEVEIRRRLWWHICLLDIRTSEDHGCDPTIIENTFNTKMPLNVLDTDLYPEMTEPPEERRGCTEMAFGLIRFEVANAQRQISYTPPGHGSQTAKTQMATLAEKERWLTECHQRLEERYLKNCDMSVPLFWVIATVARLVMSKMWLVVYHPFQKLDGYASLPAETREKLFITSLENVEYSMLLQTETRTEKWGWLFKTYMQWYPLAFLLSELRHRTSGELCERAWRAVEQARDTSLSTPSDASREHRMWRPLQRVYQRAKEARQQKLAEEAAIKMRSPSQTTMERRYSPNANPMHENAGRTIVTRAPLSAAQLQRLSEGPLYGHIPLDKHEFLRSRPSTESPPSITSPEPLNNDDRPFAVKARANTSYGEPVGANLGCPPGVTSDLVSELMAQPNSVLQSSSLSLQGGGTNAGPTPLNMSPPVSNMQPLPASFNTFDQSGFNTADLGAMDTSEDLNWQNWDQLVQQFGMEMDYEAGMDVRSWTAGPGWEIGGTTIPPAPYRGTASDDTSWL